MKQTSKLKFVAIAVAFAVLGTFLWTPARAQSQPPSAAATADPSQTALGEALAAACRQDDVTFSSFLTADNAKAFQALPPAQRTALMTRLVLLEAPGNALLSSTPTGGQMVRCESAGITTEMRFSEPRIRENLAFVPVEVSVPDDTSRAITFGMVRENGGWKLLSVGLVLFDIPALVKEWAQGDMEAREQSAVEDLRQLASALNTYRSAYGKLPDSLVPLGPAPKGEISPENAGLVDAELAAGNKDGYAFRYNIVPARGSASADDADKSAGFALAGTPEPYGTSGKRSFFLDSDGVLRGGDKQGAVATSADPRIDTP